jgi:rhamnose transport system substrate-binding protein
MTTDQPRNVRRTGSAVSRRGFLASGAVIGGAALLAACGSPASKSGASGKALKIVHVPKWTTFPYFQAANVGVKKAAGELGATLTYTGPNNPNAEQQVATLQSVVAQGPDVILLSAIEPDNVAPVLKRAMAQGITVVTYDSDCRADARQLFCNQLTYDLAAKTYLDAALMDDPRGGGVAFMAATPTTANHVGQINAMRKLIRQGGKYGAFKDGKTYFVQDDVSQSVNTMTNIMQSDPSVRYMLSASAVSVPAAAQAIDAAGKRGQVWSTGAALPSSIKKYLDDGTGQAFVLWNPSDLGYMAVHAAHLIHTGKLKPQPGTTWTAGSLGQFTVEADKVTSYNRPLVFTKQNVSQYPW